ncbi:hypothetical protein C9374_000974 [Naegleria lovaniensis]|uniref:RGS domain-containing protein n=1 Tax=Naegleria lovaniensis TaxID=51637 RepID=A0AA88GXX0_NAELO|nr:uncharacterized protein C9374_000974 [Naegleria lovaniensis]KAG2388124.1 hypothetical protein C9374_000974 [Naegleria lovaniensis]
MGNIHYKHGHLHSHRWLFKHKRGQHHQDGTASEVASSTNATTTTTANNTNNSSSMGFAMVTQSAPELHHVVNHLPLLLHANTSTTIVDNHLDQMEDGSTPHAATKLNYNTGIMMMERGSNLEAKKKKKRRFLLQWMNRKHRQEEEEEEGQPSSQPLNMSSSSSYYQDPTHTHDNMSYNSSGSTTNTNNNNNTHSKYHNNSHNHTHTNSASSIGGTTILTNTATSVANSNTTTNSLSSPPHSTTSIAGVEANELMMLLKDEIGWNLFYEYCDKEFSAENCECLVEIQKLQSKIARMNGKQRRQSCRDLHKKYFSGESSQQVNISGRARQMTKSVANSKVIDLETANELLIQLRREVVTNLRDTFSRFVLTDEYIMWKEMMLHPESIFNE